MSIRTVVTRGFGSYGSIPLVVVRGFGAEAGGAAVVTDTAGDVATLDEIRRLERAMRALRAATEDSKREQRRKEQRLTSLIDRAWRKVVLHEPEAAAEIAATVEAPEISSAALKAAIAGDTGRIALVAERLRQWLQQRQEEQAALRMAAEMMRLAAEEAEEDDLVTLLLTLN